MAEGRENNKGVMDDIDMERVVIDPDYRRLVIGRLRRDRMIAELQGKAGVEGGGSAAPDED